MCALDRCQMRKFLFQNIDVLMNSKEEELFKIMQQEETHVILSFPFWRRKSWTNDVVIGLQTSLVVSLWKPPPLSIPV